MHPELIKAQIRIAGSSLSAIARKLDVTPNAVRLIVHGNGKSRRIARAIATVTGRSLDELWPGVYGTQSMNEERDEEPRAKH